MSSSAERAVGAARAHPVRVALLAGLLGALGYLVLAPPTPDLAAQAARAAVAGAAGVTQWWPGWFAGLQLPTYSVLAPPLIALLGIPATGALAVLTSTGAMAELLRGSRRPVAGSLTFAVFATVDVFVGRTTFALGLAAALGCLVAVRRRWWWAALAGALLACLFSLLAAFFLGLGLVTVAVVSRRRRPGAVATAAAVAAVAVVAQLLFRQTGTMPYATVDLLGAAVTSGGVALATDSRYVRVGAALTTLATLVTLAVPGAIGENVVRLDWLVAPALLVATAQWRGLVVAAAAVAAAAWPLGDAAQQLAYAAEPSTQPSFYAPLLHELAVQQRLAGPAARGERVEVVPTRTHWETAYLPPHVALARGWDRQADVRDNPLFYSGVLTATEYRRWLHALAVGWVARPHTPLDGAGVAEAALVDRGVPGLRLVWHDASWDLYRVVDARPLARGARVLTVGADDVRLRFARPGTATLRLRWTPGLTVTDPAGTVAGCVTGSGTTTVVTVRAAGDYVVSPQLALDAGCAGAPGR